MSADGYLKMASDLASVVCVEGAKCQPNTWHPWALLTWFVCGAGSEMLSRPQGARSVSFGLGCLKFGCLKLRKGCDLSLPIIESTCTSRYLRCLS